MLLLFVVISKLLMGIAQDDGIQRPQMSLDAQQIPLYRDHPGTWSAGSFDLISLRETCLPLHHKAFVAALIFDLHTWTTDIILSIIQLCSLDIPLIRMHLNGEFSVELSLSNERLFRDKIFMDAVEVITELSLHYTGASLTSGVENILILTSHGLCSIFSPNLMPQFGAQLYDCSDDSVKILNALREAVTIGRVQVSFGRWIRGVESQSKREIQKISRDVLGSDSSLASILETGTALQRGLVSRRQDLIFHFVGIFEKLMRQSIDGIFMDLSSDHAVVSSPERKRAIFSIAYLTRVAQIYLHDIPFLHRVLVSPITKLQTLISVVETELLAILERSFSSTREIETSQQIFLPTCLLWAWKNQVLSLQNLKLYLNELLGDKREDLNNTSGTSRTSLPGPNDQNLDALWQSWWPLLARTRTARGAYIDNLDTYRLVVGQNEHQAGKDVYLTMNAIYVIVVCSPSERLEVTAYIQMFQVLFKGGSQHRIRSLIVDDLSGRNSSSRPIGADHQRLMYALGGRIHQLFRYTELYIHHTDIVVFAPSLRALKDVNILRLMTKDIGDGSYVVSLPARFIYKWNSFDASTSHPVSAAGDELCSSNLKLSAPVRDLSGAVGFISVGSTWKLLLAWLQQQGSFFGPTLCQVQTFLYVFGIPVLREDAMVHEFWVTEEGSDLESLPSGTLKSIFRRFDTLVPSSTEKKWLEMDWLGSKGWDIDDVFESFSKNILVEENLSQLTGTAEDFDCHFDSSPEIASRFQLNTSMLSSKPIPVVLTIECISKCSWFYYCNI